MPYPSDNIPDDLFAGIGLDRFLEEYWQKRPLCVRGAWPGFESPVTPQEFLSLSTRSGIAGRLVVEQPGTGVLEMAEGPFETAELEALPDERWTLLIQEMDRHVPDVHDMLSAVEFISNWRLDDIMVSLAAPHGGVGAHIDNYDVFLLQGLGRRLWQIGSHPVDDEVLVEGHEVSILAGFEADEEWTLEPGDMLYLPPRFAHRGVALDRCMTYSIGCRAPSRIELLSAVLDDALERLDPDDRYVDPDLRPGEHSGILGTGIVEWTRRAVMELADDEEALTALLGSVLSEPRRYREVSEPAGWSADELRAALRDGAVLRPASTSEGLYEPVQGGELLLFLSGDVFRLDAGVEPAVAALTSRRGLDSSHLDTGLVPDELLSFLADLASEGLLVVDGGS
ncbi:MAG: cupin domain-containing protein [Rhodothermales bacterium]|nr:cupin domain-containing protein [Rhodothermales bacterium]